MARETNQNINLNKILRRERSMHLDETLRRCADKGMKTLVLERNCTPEEVRMKLEERIHTLEVYLEGAINFLILNGDVDNPIIGDVENILHKTFNKNWR